jgi:hypothetical protein
MIAPSITEFYYRTLHLEDFVQEEIGPASARRLQTHEASERKSSC